MINTKDVKVSNVGFHEEDGAVWIGLSFKISGKGLLFKRGDMDICVDEDGRVAIHVLDIDDRIQGDLWNEKHTDSRLIQKFGSVELFDSIFDDFTIKSTLGDGIDKWLDIEKIVASVYNKIERKINKFKKG